MDIRFTPKGVSIVLLVCVAILVAGNIVGIFLNIGMGRDSVFGLIRLFDLNTESNIPTLFSSFLFMIAAILFAFISYLVKKEGKACGYWLGLAIVFVFLSIDESAMVHELLIHPFRTAFNTSGILFYAWVIPYGVGLLVFGLIYIRFLLSLPRKYMVLFVVSGLIFISGAIGFEVLGALQDQTHGIKNYTYSFLYTMEETFEMLGLVLMVYTLLSWIRENYGTLTLAANQDSLQER